MSIRRLRITQVRNIVDADLAFSRINLISGANGSGKTSVLEAAFLLGSGRSFRATRLDPVINHAAEECTVFGAVQERGGGAPVSVGVARRRDGSFEGRVQGRAVHNSAELARRLPLQLINSATFALLEGGPKIRRQFLDWGVFHVEHGFHRLWLEVHRCLRQRNTLLRHDRISSAQMQPWNARLAEDATQLDGFRQRYFDAFYPVFRSTLSELSPIDGLEVSYLRGWERDRELLDILDEQLERDRQRGFTVNGPHRADLRVRVRGMSADEVLSRGQQKLVICALKLAQARIFAQTQGHECVFLIDDLPAELDSRHRQNICRLLETMGCQVIVTCVDPAELEGCWGGASADDIRMFHVEQGALSIMN